MKIKSVSVNDVGTGEITKEYAEQTFKELLAFQGYGFCLGYDAEVVESQKGVVPIGKLSVGDSILTPGDSGGERWASVVNVMPQGRKDLFYVELANGRSIKCTRDHKMLCDDGEMRPMIEIMGGPHSVACRNVQGGGPDVSRIVGVTYLGEFPVMDITVKSRSHLFYANGIIVSNCKAHAVSYSVYSAVQMWLQEHYFLEYMCCLLTHIDRAKEKKGHLILNERVEYCIKHGTSIYYPDVNESGSKWEIKGGGLLAPLKNIKGFSDREVSLIESNRPYESLKDFLDKTGFNKNRFEALLFAHALDKWGEIPDLYNWYYNHYDEKGKKKVKKPATVDLFGGDEEAESSSSVEVIREFTKSELDDKCLDLNGFVICENIQILFHDAYEKKIGDLNPNASNRDKGMRIYKLSELKSATKEDVAEGGSVRWTLAEVRNVAANIRSKKGTVFSKVSLNDGETGYELCIFLPSLPEAFGRGNVVVFPMFLKFDEERNEVRMSYSNYTADRSDLIVLFKPEE